MQLAKVLGSVVATMKHDSLTGVRLLLIQPQDENGVPDGDAIVAADPLQAGEGELVEWTTGREAAPGITAAQAAANARALQQFGGPSGGPSGGPVNTGRLPTQSNSSASANTPALTGAARANRAIRGFQDSRVVNTCWQNLLRMNPSLRDASVRITLQVNGLGRFTSATVSGSPDPRFDSCLRGRLPTIAPIGAGEAFDAQTTVTLTTGG